MKFFASLSRFDIRGIVFIPIPAAEVDETKNAFRMQTYKEIMDELIPDPTISI